MKDEAGTLHPSWGDSWSFSMQMKAIILVNLEPRYTPAVHSQLIFSHQSDQPLEKQQRISSQ